MPKSLRDRENAQGAGDRSTVGPPGTAHDDAVVDDRRVPRRLSPRTERRLVELLDNQAGVVSRAQLRAIGIDDVVIESRLRLGLWQRGFSGTYVAHNGEIAYLTTVWSAVLYAGDNAMVSYGTAAFFHGLTDREPDEVHVTVPSTRRVRRQTGMVIHMNGRATQQALPACPTRTSVEETVLDLVSATTRPDEVVAVLTNACQRRRTTPARISKALALRKKIPHRALIEETLLAIADGVHSVLEWRYRRDVERAHGLPRGKRQAARRRNGKQEFVDVDYDEYGVIVELDGAAYHGAEQSANDRSRDRAAAARGKVTLRFGWHETAFTPCEAASEVAAVLATRGWKGALRPCPKCTPLGVIAKTFTPVGTEKSS